MNIKALLPFCATLLLIAAGCDAPAPTELTGSAAGPDAVRIEALEQNPTAIAAGNRYDSTGYLYQVPQFSTVIILSKNTVTEAGTETEYNFGFASFYDRNSPVYTYNGKLAGYKSGRVEYVKFRGLRATELPQYLRLRTELGTADSIIGPKYLLFKKRGSLLGDLFDLDYALPVEIEIKQFFTAPVTANIKMPEAIAGRITSVNSGIVTLAWNSENRQGVANGIIEIRLGGIHAGTREITPLFSLKTVDDGTFTIPLSILRGIPKSAYPKLVISFFRKQETVYDGANNQALLLAQVTHSLVLNTP